MPHFFYSFTASDGSEGTTAGHVVSPRSIMVHHGFRCKEARHARKKYLLRQTSHSSLLVARHGDVSRKINQTRIATMNCRNLSSDIPVKEFPVSGMAVFA